jgi:tRNA threonylcarbamoyladenosine biosynthesis protein TsaE
MNQNYTALTKTIADEAQQLYFGEQLADAWRHSELPGILIYFYGNLGAGKTTLIRGFLRGLGYQQHVKSPSYTLVETYEIDHHNILHVDLYRLHDPNELLNLGLLDEFDGTHVCLIEWPEHAGNLLPQADLACYIAPIDQGREVRLVALSERGEKVLVSL